MSFVVSQISKFIYSPRTPHLDVVNRILRYPKGTPGKRIWMKRNNTNAICGYFDADWAESFDRRSSAEAEYRAMTFTASELPWINQVLTDLNIKVEESMKIFYDNQSERYVSSHSVFHERIKHIEIDCHFIREKMQSKKIKTPFVKSED
jgi:hypothetical protein